MDGSDNTDMRSEDRGLRKVGDGDTTDNTSLRLIRRIGGGGKGPHWIDIGFTLDSLVKGLAS